MTRRATNSSPPELGSADDYAFHKLVEGSGLSPVQKYQSLVVGRPGWLALLHYELLLGTVCFVPGSAGIVLRSLLYRGLLGRLGPGVVIGRSVTLRHPHRIELGDRAVVDDNAYLSAVGPEGTSIRIGERVLVGRSSVVKTRAGQIEIGDDTSIGHECRIVTSHRLEIGRDVLLAARACVGASEHERGDLDTPISRQGLSKEGGLRIEDEVWVGLGAIVLDGLTLGRGCIVGAGAVVTRDVPPLAIAAGVPARIVGERK